MGLEVMFAQPLHLGEHKYFSIYMNQDVPLAEITRRGYTDGWRMSPTVDVDEFTIAVKFPSAIIPSVVSHFEEMPDVLAPGVPTDANLLSLDRLNEAEFTWRSLRLGYTYGIHWEW